MQQDQRSPGQKEYKEYNIDDRKVAFFSTKKLIRLFSIVFITFFAGFGALFFIELTLYPDLGMVELAKRAKRKTNIWLIAKEEDLGHEAIAFEEMLDVYAEGGGDISHSLDSLTDEFTAANWAELLEYDIDYFLKHDELSDSIKFWGMLHVTKILYSSGHYDLFKQGYKILVSNFARNNDFLNIYAELIRLKAEPEYDDEEELNELIILYELELRRHLKLTTEKIIKAIGSGELTSQNLAIFATSLKNALEYEGVLKDKGEAFKKQVESDVIKILSESLNIGAENGNAPLLTAGYDLLLFLRKRDFPSAENLSNSYFNQIKTVEPELTDQHKKDLVKMVRNSQKNDEDLAEELGYFQNL